jgi:hypothetical protein
MAKRTSATALLAGISTAAPKTTSKSDDKVTIKVDSKIAAAIDEYSAAKADIARLEARLKSAESVIKEHGTEYAVDQLGKGKTFESVIFASETNGLLFIVQDRAKMIKDDRLEQVEAVVGEDNVEAKTKLIMNIEIFEKYAEKIASALQGLNIPAEDKAQLITEETSYAYTFGLNDAARIAEEQGTTVAAVFQTFGPTLQLKARGSK